MAISRFPLQEVLVLLVLATSCSGKNASTALIENTVSSTNESTSDFFAPNVTNKETPQTAENYVTEEYEDTGDFTDSDLDTFKDSVVVSPKIFIEEAHSDLGVIDEDFENMTSVKPSTFSQALTGQDRQTLIVSNGIRELPSTPLAKVSVAPELSSPAGNTSIQDAIILGGDTEEVYNSTAGNSSGIATILADAAKYPMLDPAVMEEYDPMEVGPLVNLDREETWRPGACRFDIFKGSGDIVFPDFQQEPNNTEATTCRWRIRVPEGPNIRLRFQKLGLEIGREILEMTVDVGGEKQTRTLTGSKVPGDIVVQGMKVWLTLRSMVVEGNVKMSLHFEETTQNHTFPAASSVPCSGELTEMAGNITSPGFPEADYPDNLNCLWFIRAPTHAVVRLRLVEFSTEPYDQVKVGVGLEPGLSSTLLTLFGSLQHERETIVPASSVWLAFISDESISLRGFHIYYEVIPRLVCNTTEIEALEPGVMTSPGYPDQYPINSECSWLIYAPAHAHLNLTFTYLNVQDGHDFVLIGEGTEVFGGEFSTFTGNASRQTSLRVPGGRAWVHFTSDHLDPPDSLGPQGFSLTYQPINASEPTWSGADYVSVEGPSDNVTPKQPAVTSRVTPRVTPRPHSNATSGPPSIPPSGDADHAGLLTIPLTKISLEQLEKKTADFEKRLAFVLNRNCKDDPKCPKDKQELRAEEVKVVSSREVSPGRLEVRVLVGKADSEHAMDSLDYKELEELFHSDLQTLDLQHGPTNANGDDAANLPEWLIGVIVVVILLIIVFFAMVIYSLVKERKKTRAGSYGANQSATGEQAEAGKDDGNIRITSFIVDNEKGGSGNGWVDTESSTLQRRHQNGGLQGCRNPAFLEDEAEGKGKDGRKKEKVAKDANGEVTKEMAVDVTPEAKQGAPAERSSDVLAEVKVECCPPAHACMGSLTDQSEGEETGSSPPPAEMPPPPACLPDPEEANPADVAGDGAETGETVDMSTNL